jgi:hypothetical protein
MTYNGTNWVSSFTVAFTQKLRDCVGFNSCPSLTSPTYPIPFSPLSLSNMGSNIQMVVSAPGCGSPQTYSYKNSYPALQCNMNTNQCFYYIDVYYQFSPAIWITVKLNAYTLVIDTATLHLPGGGPDEIVTGLSYSSGHLTGIFTASTDALCSGSPIGTFTIS